MVCRGRRLLSLLPALLLPVLALAEEKTPSTNVWILAANDYIEAVSFVLADNIQADGLAYDDIFWVSSGQAQLNGRFENDVWLVASQPKLNGSFSDHARVLGHTVQIDGIISNGLWAAGGSITASTNSQLYGDHLLFGNNVTLLGHIEGRVQANARRITLGGTIVGDVNVRGDEIIIRPGTTIIGNFYYVTTNQTIVLDANSNISGDTKHIDSEVASSLFSSQWNMLQELYFFAASLLVGIPFILLFPGPCGFAVRALRTNMVKCGTAGLLFVILVPLLIFLAAFSLLGLPLAAVLGSTYGVILYIGKFPVALAIGSALIGRRGQISVSGAILSLVVGLFLFYTVALFPFIGSSLQIVFMAFGAGSLTLAIASGRGRVKEESSAQSEQSE